MKKLGYCSAIRLCSINSEIGTVLINRETLLRYKWNNYVIDQPSDFILLGSEIDSLFGQPWNFIIYTSEILVTLLVSRETLINIDRYRQYNWSWNKRLKEKWLKWIESVIIESNIVCIFENIFNNATVNIVNHVQTRLNIQFIKHEIFIIAYNPFSFNDTSYFRNGQFEM